MNETPKAPDQVEAETAAIDLESIFAIHRNKDGYIGFVRKPDPAHPQLDARGKPKAWENLFSIRTDELREMFPAFVEWLETDSYFTIGSYYRPAPYPNKTTGLPDVWRKEKYLSNLPACYVDIDCGRPESDEPGAALDWRQAQYGAGTLADRGVIPQPSIMARSGRGVYLFWLLQDVKNPALPPRAWPEKIQLYKLCNRALNALLRTHALPADKAAVDAARVLRVPGSIHRKTGRRVEYIVQLDQAGKGFVYTLPQLATFLKLPAPAADLPATTRALARPAQYRRVKRPGTAPLRSHGAQVLHALRAQDLLTLETWRGGFKKRGEKYEDGSTSPGRRYVLMLYAGFLRGAKETPEATTAALQTMAENMRPPYPSGPPSEDEPIESIVQAEYAGKKRQWKNETLCALLGITAALARELELQTIRPPNVAHEADRARPLRVDIVKARREFARQYLERYRRVTARGLANAYHHAGFIGANRQTANDDLNALGYVVNRSAGGRPRKPYRVESRKIQGPRIAQDGRARAGSSDKTGEKP